MEENINREIRNYKEQVFMGLPLRTILCSGAAIIASIVVYLRCEPLLGIEITSWICILVALPPVLLAFAQWHNMPAEQVVLIWLRNLFTPKKLAWRSTNYNALYFHSLITKKKIYKGGMKHHAEDSQTDSVLP